jgi:hypothetical protein
MRSVITDSRSAIQFVDDLAKASRIYAALHIPDHPFWADYDQRTRSNLEVLNMLRVQQPLPILLAAAEHFGEREFAKLTHVLLVMAIRYNLIGEQRTGVLSNYYVEVPKQIQAGAIRKSAQTFREIRAIYPSDQQFQQAFATKSLSSSRSARYLLSEIERHAAGGRMTPDPSNVNLDHILPRNPSQHWSDTRESIGPEELAEYTNRLGNLALVSADFNRRLGSSGFEEKKAKLFSKEEHFEFTRTIADYPTWLRADIEDRQRKLAEEAVKVWRIDV